MNVKQEILTNLKKAISELAPYVEDVQISLEKPKEQSHGDYSTSVAMAIFSKSKIKNQKSKSQIKIQNYKNPLELANAILELLNTKYQIQNTDRIEAIKPGFINFYLSKEYLMEQLGEVLEKKDAFGKSSALQKKIMVEFTDPNPFKEFHIGHLYSNIVGEALCRIFEAQGAIVKRANYFGDVGMHVAKAIYGFRVVIPDSIRDLPMDEMLNQVGHDTLKNRAALLGKAYAAGAKAFEEDEKAKEEIKAINKQVYDNDPKVLPLYKKGREWSLEYFETIYKRLGTKFDYYYPESKVDEIGLKYVKEHLQNGAFIESEGAVIFPGEKYRLHNRVFINSRGLPTYEAKDMGLPGTKYKDFPYDQSIIITAHEQSAYFQVVLKALSFINPDLAAKTMHIGHGMVRLPTGKMSSRTGQIITGEWLLDEAKRLINKNYPDMTPETSEQVAVGAIKWALLKNSIGKDIAFSFEDSISFEGNSGPYLQYTYARTRSLLAKFKIQNSKVKTDSGLARMTSFWGAERLQNLQPEEFAILRALARFPEVLEEAARTYSQNTICTYLFDLAQKFNLFYQKCPIIGSKEEEFRLALTEAVGQVIKNGLFVLGIQSPGKM